MSHFREENYCLTADMAAIVSENHPTTPQADLPDAALLMPTGGCGKDQRMISRALKKPHPF